MQNRHFLETALEAAIKNREEKNALMLVQAIRDNQEGVASLHPHNENNENYFFLAIYHRLPQLSSRLFGILKNNDAILFAKTNKNETILSEAAKAGYNDIVDFIIKRAREKSVGEPGYKIWQDADQEGKLPLHGAACSPQANSQTIALLLKPVDSNIVEYINQPDGDGNTPLHETLRSYGAGIVNGAFCPLLKAGAKLDLMNNEGKTAFDLYLAEEIRRYDHKHPLLFEELGKSEKLDPTEKLDSADQRKLLDVYYDFIMQYPEAENIDKIDQCYLRCAALYKDYNPRMLELAKVECDPSARLRRLVNASLSQREPMKDKLDLLNHDRKIINNLIQEVETQLAFLANEPDISICKTAAIYAVAVFSCLFYAGVESVLIYERIVSRRDFDACQEGAKNWEACEKEYNIADNYLVAALFFGVFGLFLPALGVTWGVKSNKEPLYFAPQWQDLTRDLTERLVEKIALLNQEDRPVMQRSIASLQEEIENLRKIMNVKTEASRILHRIASTLKDMRQEMNLSRKPFTLFAPKIPAHIEIDTSSSEDSESQLFLDKDEQRNALQLKVFAL